MQFTTKGCLTQHEAAKRLTKFGLNEIVEVRKASVAGILLRQVQKNFIIYILFLAMLISFFVGKTITAYAILGVIALVVGVGFVQEYKAEKAIQALKSIMVLKSRVIRDDKEIEIPSNAIVPGDMVILRTGDRVPADCMVLEENELRLDESVLTGESKEIKKNPVQAHAQSKEENLVFMGTFVISGNARCQAMHTGMNTKFGKIAQMISTAEKELPLQKKVNSIAKYMAAIAIIVSVSAGLIMAMQSPSLNYELMINILILVIALSVSAFPEGFPVVLITTLSYGAYKMTQKNAIVNRMSIIETLGESTVICSDKTGTITKGEMTVKKIFVENSLIEVTGSGYEGDGAFILNNKKINAASMPVLQRLIENAVFCNDATISRKGSDHLFDVKGTPTEIALLVMSAKAGSYKEDLKLIRAWEKPFSSERKLMSVAGKSGKDTTLFVKGAPEIVLERCTFIQKGEKVVRMAKEDQARILKTTKELNAAAYRTLAFAYRKITKQDHRQPETELIFLGLVGMEDPPREEVKEAIRLCKSAGIKVKMITGDHVETAIAIGRQIGLQGKVMEGMDLDEMTEDELAKNVSDTVIFARVRPEHKLRIVRALKQNNEVVAMTGDGVNDAPALKEAHIGIAMGIKGTDVSRSVADLTLKDDNFATIVAAIKEGRTIYHNIQKFVTYQLSCNCAELLIILIGLLLTPLLGWQIPVLVALQILFMNLVTDNLPAITLGLNPSSTDIMEEKPRKKKEILTPSLIALLLFTGIILTVLCLSVFFITFNIFGQSIETARTTTLVTLILLEIANAFNFRSFRKGVLNRSPFANPMLVYASVISVFATLLVIYSPLNQIFETVPLQPMQWIISIIPVVLVLFAADYLKEKNNREKFWSIEAD